jgi:hypothetical protein
MLRATILAAAATRAGALQVGVGARAVRARSSMPAMEAFYDFSANKLDGSAASMADFKGKPVLILNVASL